MRAFLIAVGERMPAWVQDGYAEYARRLSRELPLQLVEISTKSRDPARVNADEGAALLAAIPKSAHVVALDGRGKAWSSEDVAVQLARWRMLGKDLAFVIGGADGLDPELLGEANGRLAFGPQTWPHALARAMLAEQIYRAGTILAGGPYHRD